MGSDIAENIARIRARIEAAAARAGRDASIVTLLAATKNRAAEEVQSAVEAGVRVAGENRVQELMGKAALVTGPLEWHFIGHLQRNKVKQVVGKVSLIHSLDSLRLAREIEERAALSGVTQRVLVQVNVAGEASKSGVDPAELAEIVEEVSAMEHLTVEGLSTVAPLSGDPERVRWVFRRLAELASELEAGGPGRRVLSMGMTDDFEVAVEEGSTCVRVGTGIFGPRARE